MKRRSKKDKTVSTTTHVIPYKQTKKEIEWSQIEIAGITASKTALFIPSDLSFNDWIKCGTHLSKVIEGIMWWIGDWWRHGEAKYGDRAAAALNSNTYSFQTFMDAGWVASKFETTSRRREVLSWSHHREVAGLEPPQADELLDLAVEYSWSRQELRVQVKRVKRENISSGMADLAQDMDPDSAIQIYCESYDQLAKRLRDGSVSLLLTDPPYGVEEAEWDTWEDSEAFWTFTSSWLSIMRPKMAEEFTAFIFCDADASPRICQTMLDTGWPVLRQAIWYRPNLAKKRSGSLTFLSAYEPFWHAGTRPLILPDDWGEERFDVQRFVVPQSNFASDPAYHPTQKPIELFKRLVQVGSKPNELILDPFCGSGTTAVASKLEGRRCIASDQSLKYVKITQGRLAVCTP